MKEKDFRKNIEAAAVMSRESVDSHFAWRGHFSPGPGGEGIRDSLIDNVWNVCLAKLGTNSAESGPLDAEKVVIGLLHRGVSRDRMPFKNPCFRIMLDNCEYRIYKRPSGFAARPWNTSGHELRELRVDPDEFAAFLLEFDRWIPEIRKAADEVFLYYKDKVHEKQKAEMVQKIMDYSVAALIDQYIRPLGLSANYVFVKDGTAVSLELRQIRRGTLEIPVEELAERLQDTRAILDSLVAEKPALPPEPIFFDRGNIRIIR